MLFDNDTFLPFSTSFYLFPSSQKICNFFLSSLSLHDLISYFSEKQRNNLNRKFIISHSHLHLPNIPESVRLFSMVTILVSWPICSNRYDATEAGTISSHQLCQPALAQLCLGRDLICLFVA